MLIYFIVTCLIAAPAVIFPKHYVSPLLWSAAFLMITVFVGLRHHVGMDWNNYIWMIQKANESDIWGAFNVAEPGFALLLWFSGQAGWGIYGTYVIGTIIFATGLFSYARTTPYPWIALLVAMPFLVIVISMSAARQAIAIGILLWLLSDWIKASFRKRIAMTAIASTFHVSATGFLLFVFLDSKASLWTKIAGTLAMAALILYILQASGHAKYYNSVYGTGQTELTYSPGALTHVLLNGGPAIIVLLLHHRIRQRLLPNRIHLQMAIISCALIPLAVVASTASSRITLYLFPVSMFFFSALPTIARGATSKLLVKSMVAIICVMNLFVWLNFANSSLAHRKYQNALLLPASRLELCCR